MGSCYTCQNVTTIPPDQMKTINLMDYQEFFFFQIEAITKQEKNNLFLSFEIFNAYLEDQIKFSPYPVFIMKWEIGYALRTLTQFIDNSNEWITFIQGSDYNTALNIFNCVEDENNIDVYEQFQQWELIKISLNSLVKEETQFKNYLAFQYFRQILRYLQQQIIELKD
ncbi:unnamed protein product [Paramecium primaurelia]|uniref:Uncharacterized protein n=1 Tax=Paramecium primaurelia TaxID=5886 RepID=A0A8S1PWD0_PARPR|nr:unnamed protein product [Paramecium primaurelia]